LLRVSVLVFTLAAGAGIAVAQANPGSLNQQPAEDPTSASAAPPTYAPVPGQAGQSDRVIRISGGVMAGMLQNRVNPDYPPDARKKHLQGAVVLAVHISRDGNVMDVQPVSGPSALMQAAVDAVRQWTYRPYLLNGQPVEVNTTVTVNFNLSGSSEL
jgi:TonB family protein